MTAGALAREREWQEATGWRVAYAPAGDAWACASRQELQLFEDDALVAAASAAGEVLGELTFSSDGTRVLVAPLAYDRGAGAWAPRPAVTEALVTGLEPDAATGFAASAGAWAADGSALAVYGEYRPPRGLPARGGRNGPPARLVLLDGGEPSVLWEGERSEPRGAIFVGETVVACGGRAIDVRDRASGRPLAVLPALPAVARVLRPDPAGRRRAAGAAGGPGAVWDAASWEELARWPADPGEAAALAWRPDGEALATGGSDCAVRLWTPAGDPLAEHELGEPVSGLAFHPGGGRLLAAQSGAGVVALTAPA
jgi:WD40 repeat protein